MNSFVSAQAEVFLLAIANGVFLGLLYDVLRVLRRMVKHSRWLVSVEDFVYWVVSSVIIFMDIFYNNDGSLRGFLIMGVILGLILYYLLLSKLIIGVFMKIYHIILRIVKTIAKILWFPIKIILKPFHFLIRKVHKLLKKFGKWLIIKYKKMKRHLKIMIKKK